MHTVHDSPDTLKIEHVVVSGFRYTCMFAQHLEVGILLLYTENFSSRNVQPEPLSAVQIPT